MGQLFPLSLSLCICKMGTLRKWDPQLLCPRSMKHGRSKMPQNGTLQTQVALHCTCSSPCPALMTSRPPKLKNFSGMAGLATHLIKSGNSK